MKTKMFEDWTFQEVVEYYQGKILKELLAGNFETAVWSAVEGSMRWHKAQTEKKPKKRGGK